VKAPHIVQRYLHGCEATFDHVPFVGGEGFDEIPLSTRHGDKPPTKRRSVPQRGVGADPPEWRHIVKASPKSVTLCVGQGWIGTAVFTVNAVTVDTSVV